MKLQKIILINKKTFHFKKVIDLITCPVCPIVMAFCKIAPDLIVDTVCGCVLPIICGFPVTLAPRTGELNTVGAPLIWDPFDVFVNQAVFWAGLGVLGGLTNV